MASRSNKILMLRQQSPPKIPSTHSEKLLLRPVVRTSRCDLWPSVYRTLKQSVFKAIPVMNTSVIFTTDTNEFSF